MNLDLGKGITRKNDLRRSQRVIAKDNPLTKYSSRQVSKPEIRIGNA